MKSEEIRKTFLKYFEERGHKVMPSASLIPADPTVLLTLAGMLPFKPIFLGVEKPHFKRAASVQKCLRMNDIENVGKTSRHHTFFEMLGNFSFGDYFKKEAIAFAWELLTGIFSLPAEKLVVAVYEKDDETAEIWKKDFNLPGDKLYRLSEDNNFWAAGPTGPCGPCSEIYYDYGSNRGCGKPDCSPACDCERFLEVWNLVFIEFNRDESGRLNPLPSKNIDTGMGLERIARLLQNVETNFETDLFAPIIAQLPQGAEISRRIVADHLRAAVYLIADAVRPGNEGRDYVLRRIIRRAALHGRKLGLGEAFLSRISPTIIDIGKNVYPELKSRSKTIQETIKAEEESFEKTLDAGMKLAAEMFKKYGKVLPGEEAFKLHDTYGFPIEITREIAAEQGVTLNEAGYASAMEKQKSRARSALKTYEDIKKQVEVSRFPKTNFIGYDKTEGEARIQTILKDDNLVILDKTCFYPEGGGQVGDTGILIAGKKEILVQNTFGEIGGVILHRVESVQDLKEKETVKFKIDASKRCATCAHHTATHLLHAALRSILGPEATQAGSLVAPDRLRFDFRWPQALTIAEIEKIEKMVNEKIKAKIKVEISETSLAEAQKLGAMALFGEKYGKKVRVVKIPETSLELCGGCHVKNTGEISFFKITKEEALQAGVRRIEAVAGPLAKVYIVFRGSGLREQINKLMRQHRIRQAENELLGGSKTLEAEIFEIDQEELDRLGKAVDKCDLESVNKFLSHLMGRLEWIQERNHKLEKEIEKLKGSQILGQAEKILSEAQTIKDIKIIAKDIIDAPMPALRNLSDKLRSLMGSGIIILASVGKDKVSFLVTVSDDLTGRYQADKLSQVLTVVTGGGGGGKATKAEAGGRDPSKVGEAFKQALESL